MAACGPERSASSSEFDNKAEAARIARDYIQSGDAGRARIELQGIEVANPSHWLLFLTEEAVTAAEDPETTQALVQLTIGLGLQSRLVTQYAQQHNLLTAAPEPTFEVVQPSESNVIALQPAPQNADEPDDSADTSADNAPAVVLPAGGDETSEAPTGPGEESPDTAESAPAAEQQPAEQQAEQQVIPANPMIQATNILNVRGGPGTDYPVVSSIQTGAQAEIIARNPQSDWWQVNLAGGQQGWVYGPLVTTSGDTGTINVATNIPAPPPTPTPAPVAQAPAAPAEPAPAEPQPEEEAQPEAPPEAEAQPEQPAQEPSGETWTVVTKLRPVGQDAQSCSGGSNDIHVLVIDATGNPLSGVRVQEIFTREVKETGGSGPGRIHWNIYRGGGGQVQLVDNAGNPISPTSEGMSADWPAFHMMLEAGYCNCKPHPDPASCESDLNNKTFLFAVGHYTYEVTFQRNH